MLNPLKTKRLLTPRVFAFLLSPVLAPLSWCYHIGYIIHRTLKRRQRSRLSRTVISVGNLSAGGTGKTPFVVQLVQRLIANGRRPAILTRGYRGIFRKPVESELVMGDSGFISDEVALMQERLEETPIGVGVNRKLSADKILEKYPIDVFILDDGFQHWTLDRDLDLALIDATNPWAGGHLLPWGLLREPVKALKRADAVILTRTELVSGLAQDLLVKQIKEITGSIPIFRTYFQPELMTTHNFRISLNFLKGKKVVAFSGIGNPKAFEQFLEKQGMDVTTRRFRDHYMYTEQDIRRLFKDAQESRSLLVTTEKDWMKVKRIPKLMESSYSKNLYILQVDLLFQSEDEDRWKEYLKGRLS